MQLFSRLRNCIDNDSILKWFSDKQTNKHTTIVPTQLSNTTSKLFPINSICILAMINQFIMYNTPLLPITTYITQIDICKYIIFCLYKSFLCHNNDHQQASRMNAPWKKIYFKMRDKKTPFFVLNKRVELIHKTIIFEIYCFTIRKFTKNIILLNLEGKVRIWILLRD